MCVRERERKKEGDEMGVMKRKEIKQNTITLSFEFMFNHLNVNPSVLHKIR